MSSEATDTPASATEPDFEPQRTALSGGTELAGRYRVERLIGEGGMGEVYLATHLKIDKQVAIKVLAPEQMRRPRNVNRFLQEAKATSRVRHPNVVDITDYGESQGCAFFVMEYLEGCDLSALLKREGRMPWERARGILIQVLEALAAAHKAGIVHRDIKPHNIFITQAQGQADFATVIDFGIAKLREGTGEQLTRTGAIVGTAEYMSPEQGLGGELDGRSDLYSAGIILYRMLTGGVPFAANNPMGVLFHHVHSPLEPASVRCPDAGIGEQLDQLVGKALAKDPDDRYASAEAFVEAVRAVDDPTALANKRRSMSKPMIAALSVVAIMAVGGGAWALGHSESEQVTVGAAALSEVVAPSELAAQEPVGTPVEAVVDTPAEAVVGTPVEAVGTPTEPVGTPAVVETDSAASSASKVPTRRSERSLRRTFGKLRKSVRACAKKAGVFPGEKISVEVSISTTGRLSKVSVKGAHSKAGRGCVSKAMRRARPGQARRAQTYKHTFSI